MEQIYQDRDQFAKLVREVAAPDVGRMGIEILSFTIKVSRAAGLSSSSFDEIHSAFSFPCYVTRTRQSL